MIKNIVFDLGNVLVEFEPEKYLEKHCSNPKIIDEVYKIIFCSPQWPELDRGIIAESDAVDTICKSYPKYEEIIRGIMTNWCEMLLPMEETVKILKDIKSKGYPIYILSNYPKRGFEYIFERNDFFKLVDGIAVSHKLDMLKPQPVIYAHLLNEYKLIPEETLFIDDTAVNVVAAQEAGINTIQFEGAEKLRSSLIELGIL